MTTRQAPWHGILVATAVPMRDNGGAMLDIDFDAYADHVRFLAEGGCHGVTPNGSLGEYHNLTSEERARIVTTAIEAAPEGFTVMPGIAAYGSDESVRWADQAAEAGAHAVMLLPPNAYRASDADVIAHYRAVAAVGLPVVAYNNPFDTRVDLRPELLAELHGEGLIQGVKEFSGDVRRYYMIKELAPELDVMAGADDVALEFAVAGSPGWISGYPNAIPAISNTLWEAAAAHDLDTALPLYRALHPLLRWDSHHLFVQAIKLSMDVVGRYGGPCRPPRGALPEEIAAKIIRDTEAVMTVSV
jgi:dihydrodipicolinate synthase/N-acetylneuraminate lyase